MNDEQRKTLELIRVLTESNNSVDVDVWLHDAGGARSRADAVVLKNAVLFMADQLELFVDWEESYDHFSINFEVAEVDMNIYFKEEN